MEVGGIFLWMVWMSVDRGLFVVICVICGELVWSECVFILLLDIDMWWCRLCIW